MSILLVCSTPGVTFSKNILSLGGNSTKMAVTHFLEYQYKIKTVMIIIQDLFSVSHSRKKFGKYVSSD